MVHLKYTFLAVLKTLDLLPSTSQTYAVPMIPLGPWFIVLPHLVPFPTLYKNKKGIQFTPSELILEPPDLFTYLASVVMNNRNTILPPLYNISSKTHPWYPILLGKSLHNLVLQQMHELSAVWHVQFDQLRLPEPSSRCFCLPQDRAHVELFLMKITGPVLIWMLLTCEVFPQLVKPSFLLGN